MQTQNCTKARLTPAAFCWTQTSELYVGCTQGFLLLVNPESLSVSVLFNPTCKQTLTQTIGCGRLLKTFMRTLYNVLFSLCSAEDAIPELGQDNFQCLTLGKNGLITKGKVNTNTLPVCPWLLCATH